MDSDQLKRQFEAAVQVIQNLPKDGSFKPSHELMLNFYGYYKQATQGKCKAAKPSFWDVVGKAKWDAWSKLGSMSADEAMQGYVEELKQIIETMPQTDEVNGLLTELDNFYTLVDLKTGQPIANGHSSPQADSEPLLNEGSEPETSNMNGHLPTTGTATSANNNSVDLPDSTTDSAMSNQQQTLHEVSLSINSHDESFQSPVTSHSGEVNGLDLIGQSVHTGTSSDRRGQHTRSAPDLIHQSSNVLSLSSLPPSQTEAMSIDSDTDSEVYLDSSEVVPSESPRLNDVETQEKTVDLLESCSKPSAVATAQSSPLQVEPAGAASRDFTDHSSHLLNGSTPRTRAQRSKQHSVTFAVPESSDLQSGGGGNMNDVNEKLRMALLNMQQEISSLDKRLSLVEQITVNQRKRQLNQDNLLMKWWPFPGLSPKSALFIFIWPVFVVWFMRFLAARRRRT